MNEYKTIIEAGTGEIVEKKSHFIGYVRHTESEEEALAFINEIRKKHYDARHNCFAYCVDGEHCKASSVKPAEASEMGFGCPEENRT